ncbi:hypothetical protein LY78DRAFT_137246 [Colletotrichum sublineola]|nr:hypothetical protein LY78DRAFT_137246 [Colletotrichum sublineola]
MSVLVCDESVKPRHCWSTPAERWPGVRIPQSAKELQGERDWPLTKKSTFRCQGFSRQPSTCHPPEWRGHGPLPRTDYLRYRNPTATPQSKCANCYLPAKPRGKIESLARDSGTLSREPQTSLCQGHARPVPSSSPLMLFIDVWQPRFPSPVHQLALETVERDGPEEKRLRSMTFILTLNFTSDPSS